MEKNEFINVKLELDKKFLKFYTAKYRTNGKNRDYYFVSRNDTENLTLVSGKIKPTAIEAFTYLGNKVIMIEEFRSAIGKKFYSFTAGLIEDGEDVKEAIKREIYEEIGGKVKNIELLQNYPMAICAGLTDEANYFAIVELESLGKQHLEETEDIKVKEFEVEELEKLIKHNKLPLTASGYFGAMMVINKIKNKQ